MTRLGVEAALVGRWLVRGDVAVEDGVVVAVALQGGPPGRGIAAPGFVDLHVNGFAGVDLLGADADGWRAVGEALRATGVVAYRPTFITSAEDVLVDALRSVPDGTLGAHLEGPFLAADFLRVHPAAHRRDPDGELLTRLLDAGPVAQVTLAPELDGALDLLDACVARGVLVSLGHTGATAAQAHAAFDRGARSLTHAFNAMRPPAAREPGPGFAALARDDVTLQVIADRVHVADDALRTTFAAAPGRVALVTDAVAAAGAPDGSYALGDLTIARADGVARDAEGRLAGSTLTMDQAVRNAVELGLPLHDALAAASTVPAQLAGHPELGRIDVGASARIVVLDDRLEVVRTVYGAAAA